MCRCGSKTTLDRRLIAKMFPRRPPFASPSLTGWSKRRGTTSHARSRVYSDSQVLGFTTSDVIPLHLYWNIWKKKVQWQPFQRCFYQPSMLYQSNIYCIRFNENVTCFTHATSDNKLKLKVVVGQTQKGFFLLVCVHQWCWNAIF